jgi:glycosyltransferase involved in cell wall biosynthesis
MKNKIALIMSVYKNDKLDYLKESLESLYNQTCKEFDIFIQCDGSLPYNLEKYLDSELEKSKIFYLKKREENRGLAFSLNELLDKVLQAEYDFVARMDADDISVSIRIEQQYIFMKDNPNIDVCGAFIEEFNTDTKEKQIISYPEKSNEILFNMKKRNSIAHVTTFFRKSFFEKVGKYDEEKLNEDFDLWIRGFKEDCHFYNLQYVLVRVRTSQDFFNRRRNLKRAIEVMYLKIDVTKTFSLGFLGYIYAIAHFMLFMSPGWVKSFIYKHLRK